MTFIHPIEELVEVLGFAVVQMLLPAFSVLTSQQDQFPLFAPHGAKVRYLDNDRPVGTRQGEIQLTKLVISN